MPAYLNALETAVPPHCMTQAEVGEKLAAHATGKRPALIKRLFSNTGIETRHFVQPATAYLSGQNWTERNQIYLAEGQALLEIASNKALESAGIEPGQVDAIVCVSSTGIATPSIPSQMIASMGFRDDCFVLPLFGYGCAGGVMGLQVARDIVLARTGAKVLLLTVELCSLAFNIADGSKKATIASTLFADGASAAILSDMTDGPCLGAFHQVTWPDTRALMGWDIDDFGFGLILSPHIPSFVERHFAPVVRDFVASQGLVFNRLSEPACHPGGRKVIEAIETQFDHLGDGLAATRRIYTQYGNMSSPTVHFVLRERLDDGVNGPLLLTALGPGFSGALGIIEP